MTPCWSHQLLLKTTGYNPSFFFLKFFHHLSSPFFLSLVYPVPVGYRLISLKRSLIRKVAVSKRNIPLHYKKLGVTPTGRRTVELVDALTSLFWTNSFHRGPWFPFLVFENELLNIIIHSLSKIGPLRFFQLRALPNRVCVLTPPRGHRKICHFSTPNETFVILFFIKYIILIRNRRYCYCKTKALTGLNQESKNFSPAYFIDRPSGERTCLWINFSKWR